MIIDNEGPHFTARLSRADKGTAREMLADRGMEYSNALSTATDIVLTAGSPWSVADLPDYATPAAREKLAPYTARIDASRKKFSNTRYAVPPDRDLWPYQKASLDYVFDSGFSLIADSPGCGKTMQAIVYANEIKAKRVLVICPAAIRFQWVKQITAWTTKLKPFNYVCLAAKNGIHPNADYTVLSYALARNPALVAAIVATGYDLLIVDESHNLKDGDSQQTRAILGQADGKYHPKNSPPIECIMSACADVLFLSGTPLVNRPTEAYSTCRALSWDSIDYMSKDKFKDRFNPGGLHKLPNGKRFSDMQPANTIELGNRMRGGFMVRHLKKEVMTQLKLPAYDIVRVEETKAVKQALRVEGLLGFDIEALQTTSDYETLGHIAEARRLMGVAIAPQVAEYVETLLLGGEEKVVVFAWHLDVLSILETALAKYGVGRIDGSTGSARSAAIVHKFCTDPSTRVLVGNIKSIGTGVDGLQEVCTRCVLAEPSWVPGDNQQAVDRLDRGGQKGQVNADFMVAPGSLSEKILISAVNKAQTITKVLD